MEFKWVIKSLQRSERGGVVKVFVERVYTLCLCMSVIVQYVATMFAHFYLNCLFYAIRPLLYFN